MGVNHEAQRTGGGREEQKQKEGGKGGGGGGEFGVMSLPVVFL